MRVADGVMVVVDCMEGVCLHTETALRYALSERLKPVLVISKLDTAILDHQLVCTSSLKQYRRTVLANLTLHADARGSVCALASYY